MEEKLELLAFQKINKSKFKPWNQILNDTAGKNNKCLPREVPSAVGTRKDCNKMYLGR